MYMLKKGGYEQEKTRRALGMLLVDRKNEFRELASALAPKKSTTGMENWEMFVLNFCLDVDDAFKSWSGKSVLEVTSPTKALTILRQLGRGKNTMNQLSHMLNISYDLATEFKVIYNRIG